MFPALIHPPKGSVFPIFFVFLSLFSAAPNGEASSSTWVLRVRPAAGPKAHQIPRRPPKPGIPTRGGDEHLAARPLPETSYCQRQNLPCRPWRPPRGHTSTPGQNLLPPGAKNSLHSAGEPQWALGGARRTRPHARKGGKAFRLPGLLLHTRTSTSQNGIFFLSPSPFFHPPMLFFTSAFVCKWQESKLLVLLLLRFKWSWQIKPS